MLIRPFPQARLALCIFRDTPLIILVSTSTRLGGNMKATSLSNVTPN